MPHRGDTGRNVANQSDIPFRGRAAAAAGHRSLIDELEAAVANRDIGARADILRRLTDLFVIAADQFSNEQLDLFDDVMCRLLDRIERSALAAFGERLSMVANAPPKVCRMLALDESVEVAGPLLSASAQLDDATLVAGARTQDHMLAISRRKVLSEDVTDVLIKRGDRRVVVSTAANDGAQFSEYGYSALIFRSRAMANSHSRFGRGRKFHVNICSHCSQTRRMPSGLSLRRRIAKEPAACWI